MGELLPDLLSCPFCGNAPSYCPDNSYGSTVISCHCELEPCAMSRDPAEAIAAWNRRTPSNGSGEAREDEEYMTVTLSRDGLVQSHNAYDADFDEMVRATETIIRVLSERLSNRKFCPYSHGSKLKNAALAREGK
jgi:hypothetical protein